MSANPPLPSGAPAAEEPLAYEWRGWAVYPRNGETTPWIRGEHRTSEAVPVAVVPCSPDSVVLVLTKEEARCVDSRMGDPGAPRRDCEDCQSVIAKLRAAQQEVSG